MLQHHSKHNSRICKKIAKQRDALWQLGQTVFGMSVWDLVYNLRSEIHTNSIANIIEAELNVDL